MNKLMKDENYLDSVIIKGKERAINVADPVLNKIYEMKILTNKSCIIIHRNSINKDKLTNKFKEIRVETYGKSKIIFCKLK